MVLTGLACVIPFHEGSGTIGRALDSVLASEFCQEIILVSDASPQPLRPALHKRHLQFESSGRLRIVELATNLGQGGARNIGAALCTAPFLSFLDQDDELLPGFHEAALQALLQSPGAAAVEAGADLVRDGLPLLEAGDPRYGLILESVPWNIVIRRSAFWVCGGFPTSKVFRSPVAGEDIAFKTALKACFAVHPLQMAGVRHHVREGSATDRFLARTQVDAQGVHFLDRHPLERDGELARGIRDHVTRAVDNSRAAGRALGRMFN